MSYSHSFGHGRPSALSHTPLYHNSATLAAGREGTGGNGRGCGPAMDEAVGRQWMRPWAGNGRGCGPQFTGASHEMAHYAGYHIYNSYDKYNSY